MIFRVDTVSRKLIFFHVIILLLFATFVVSKIFFIDQSTHKIRILAVGQLSDHGSRMSELAGRLDEIPKNKIRQQKVSNFEKCSGVYDYTYESIYSFVMFLGTLGTITNIPAAVVQHIDSEGRAS